MFRSLITLIFTSGTVLAWAPMVSRHCFHSDTTLCQSSHDEGIIALVSRRGMFGTVFAAASLTFLPLESSARDRNGAVPSGWPYAPSPLPSAVASATLSSSVTVSYEGSDDPLASFGAELSGMKTINTSVNVTGGGGNLDEAIDQSMRKKRIDPRTHG